MTPGAVAAILYARCRACEPTFQLESEVSPSDPTSSCFIITANWWSGNGFTFSAQLAIDVPDVVRLLQHVLARLDRRAAARGS